MENVILTNMCMIIDSKSNQVLVQDRIKDWKGISFPGGHIEKGEAIVASVIREVKEETGLDCIKLKFVGLQDCYDHKKEERYLVFLFVCHKFQGELISKSDEGNNMWINLDHLKEYKLSTGFDKMIDVFLENKLEMFYEDNLDENEDNRWKEVFY